MLVVSYKTEVDMMKLYRVTYKVWNGDFSRLVAKEILSVGDTKEDAIALVMKNTSRNTRDFRAEEIEKVFGHKVYVE